MDPDGYLLSLPIHIQYREPIAGLIIASAAGFIVLLLLCFFAISRSVLLLMQPDELNELKGNNQLNSRLLIGFANRPQRTKALFFALQSILHLLFATFLFHSLMGIGILMPNASQYALFIVGALLLLLLFEGIIPRFIVRNRPAIPLALAVSPYVKAAEWLLMPILKLTMTIPRTAADTAGLRGETSPNSNSREDEKDMIDEIVHFYHKTAEEIMVPRVDMKTVDIKTDFDGILDLAIHSGFSRIPVYEESEDDIKGVLYVKDLLRAIKHPDRFEWQTLIRPVYFVPETKKIDDLLEEFRTNKIHIALVVDEFGGTAGLVTMEDVLEEIVGEISDEYDADKRQFLTLPDGDYIFEGKIQLIDFFRETEIAPSDFGKMTDDVDTLAGLLLKIKGTLPHRREIIDYGNYRFTILEADERRVLKVRFSNRNESHTAVCEV